MHNSVMCTAGSRPT